MAGYNKCLKTIIRLVTPLILLLKNLHSIFHSSYLIVSVYLLKHCNQVAASGISCAYLDTHALRGVHGSMLDIARKCSH